MKILRQGGINASCTERETWDAGYGRCVINMGNSAEKRFYTEPFFYIYNSRIHIWER